LRFGFGFFDARGDKQLSTCLKALRDLEEKGHFVLPPAATAKSRKLTPRRLAEAVPAAESVKEIYVYPLEPSFRTLMGVPPDDSRRALAFDDDIEANSWAASEFGGALLGDTRLSRRLVDSAATAATQPGRAFCGIAKGDWPAVKDYDRLIDAPDESAVTMENILLPLRERTVRRMKSYETVLCVQDGTDLNFSGLAPCEGLGTIGTNQTGASSRGLHLHSTLAITTEGIPLGVLRAQCAAPEPKSKEDHRSSTAIPIGEKYAR